ncbi:hypothetical protein DLM75_21580 [Leptospira stimsonii]|uniref:Uncharacterized protein n=1 Tax=Leptospira stimsonii TaxID=2202203 RepID=A0A396YUN1_9LEPT|nr:hypothetical protein DLM75_21580 [Leptospira stimsonii]
MVLLCVANPDPFPIRRQERRIEVLPNFKRTLLRKKVLKYLSDGLNICIAFYQMKSKFGNIPAKPQKRTSHKSLLFGDWSGFTRILFSGRIF